MSDVVDLIMSDHREVERLFDVLKNDPSTRALNLPVLTALLTAHSRAEEAEVYPAAAEAGGAEDVEHGQKEHLEADQLLARLAETDPDAPEFESRLQDLVDAISHHVEEEETTVLPAMRERMSQDELRDLAERFSQVRANLLGEQPDDITREQLVQQAQNLDLDAASGRSKAELAAELKDQAEL
ncbi:hemerythrin domain-containing protein [Nocardioides marmorisolisilvae]|uniref:Hemerythrin domain-containing protein n=1 Tax=Nocardioides marmorisolisilvae TaxID=1542737 RepID=A0A3N0DX62_9ACTN|nr:hemerythrin domain-containing protein [Nocardioides marmorisolisilvae]RNL80204.1 hemerythrin domain-containing protein [Nocardioides marmorisolisilvae]